MHSVRDSRHAGVACLCSTRQQQSISTALAWTEEHRSGAEGRWREGISLELFGAGQSANDHAVGTPDGVVTARAIALEPDKSVRDVELLLPVKGFRGTASDGTRRSGSGCRKHCCPPAVVPVFANRASSRREFLTRDGCTLEGTSRSRSPVKLQDVKVVLQTAQKMIDQFLTTANAKIEWRAQCVTKKLEPTVSNNPRDKKVKWHQVRTCSWGERRRSSGAGAVSGDVPASPGDTKNGRRCRVAEFARPCREPTCPVCTR